MKHWTVEEAFTVCGVSQETITTFIQEEWITPVEVETPLLDEEDLARISLIQELKEEFGVNDEAMPIILHLLDQLYCLECEVKKIHGT